MLDPYIAVGEILKPHGLSGEVKIKPFTQTPERFWELGQVYIGEEGALHPIEVKRIYDGFVYAAIEDIDTSEAAESLRGDILYIDREDTTKLPEDADLIVDLVGCHATDTDGVDHGVLTEVLQPGGCDVYVFEGPGGTLMVPALKRVVLTVDVHAKKILLDADTLAETGVTA